MARKWRNGQHKSEKGTEPKEEAGFLGKLLSFISRAPFPINGIGLLLRRIPSPWNKRALAIVLIAIGILIVYLLIPPVQDFSLWLYYRVIPGPSVLVNFNNSTGKSVRIGKEFKFWISENQKDNRDNAINGIRAMPDGAITIPAGTIELVHIRLARNREIHRLYRGDGYLRLCFDVDADKKEVEDYCSTVISEGLSLAIYNPDKWISQPIALWFSEMEDSETNMEDSETNKDYLPDHVFKATRMIIDTLDVFEILAFEPIKHDPNRIVLNIKIGCYRTKESGEKELILEIEEKEGKVEIAEIGELYENPNKFESSLYVERIIKQIRKGILDIYPPQGIIGDLNTKIIPSKENLPQRESILDIGHLTGVRRGDVFNVLPQNQDKVIGKAQVTHALERESIAVLISDSDEVKTGCRVKWIYAM